MSIDPQSLHHAIVYLSFNLTKALTAVIQRDSFLYWPFLLAASALALIVAGAAARGQRSPNGQSFWKLTREYFRAAVWWHRSARADYRLYFANALMLPLIFGALLFSETHVVNLINAALGKAAASGQQGLEAASIGTRLVFTVFFFLAYDFGRFVAHSMLHDVPVLWEFHKVHHSAETLNPITTFRAHPIDLLVMAWVPAVMTGIATWTFNQFAATPVSFYSFLGLHVLDFAFNLVGTLRHTHVWLSYGQSWSKWFISPAQHQLHHSYEAKHLGCNRGFELAVWDRLYGTLYVPVQKETFRMGLGDGTDGQWHSLTRMYWWPFWNAGRHLVKPLRGRTLEPPPSPPSP
jgi:sterol desaturase/sphingolipid hydroxylase (fatty acid hydroxylase superfamily)